MSSRELLQSALCHRTPSRIPIDFGSTAVTGMHVSCIAALREYLGLEKRPVKVHEPYQMLGWIDRDLHDVLGLDCVALIPRNTMFGFPNENWKTWKTPFGLEVLVSQHFQTTVDEQGNVYVYPEGDLTAPASAKMPNNGYFFDTIVRQPPIDDQHLNPEDNLEEFQPISDADLQHIQDRMDSLQSSEKAITATFGGTAFGDIALVPAPFLKYPKGIRDIEEWYISTATRQEYIHKIFERQCELALQNLEAIYAIAGERIDVVFYCGTDFGTQSSTFCSLRTFQNLYMPYYKQVNQWIHSHTTWKTFKHSCGAVEKLIPAFIESGFDVLNPVQCSAKGMDAALLKQKYGAQIVFWGGGIDTQKVLPFGTPEEVRKEVLLRCEIFSPGGGFVFNTIHNVQAGTPVENIVAMFNAVREFNGQEPLTVS